MSDERTPEQAAGEWLLAGIERARAEVPRDGGDGSDLVLLGLDAAEQLAPEITALGVARGSAVLAHLGEGNLSAARLAYLAGRASFAERLAASSASTAATLAATAQREAEWEALKTRALEVGLTALRIAVPLLLAAL